MVAKAVIEQASASTNGDGWKIDVDQKRKDIKAFLLVLQGEDDDAMTPFLMKAVKSWPYPYDPTLVESYDELTASQLAEVVIRVKDGFQRLYDDILKRSGVPGDVARDNAE